MTYKESLECTETLYMNPFTGSVDTLDGWHPRTPATDELVEVECDGDNGYYEV